MSLAKAVYNTVNVLALDIDGVLTDGRTWLGSSGDEQKCIAFHDLDAVSHAQSEGMQVVLVTGEDSPAVDRIADRFNISRVWRGAKNKGVALQQVASELDVPLDTICYIGDSDRDAPALRMVGLGLVPANATPIAKQSADRILSRSGGEGAVAEAVSLLMALRRKDETQEQMRQQLQRVIEDSLSVQQHIVEHLPDLLMIAEMLVNAIITGHKIMFCGNGGSAADAQHVAGELVGRFLQDSEPWPAIALTTDTSILTAVSNDWAFEEVFARQIRALCKAGDVVVGISTSGKSANVLRAIQAAHEMGAKTIGFTGLDGGDMPELTDICFCAPTKMTPRIQELHLLAWHAICEVVEEQLLSLR